MIFSSVGNVYYIYYTTTVEKKQVFKKFFTTHSADFLQVTERYIAIFAKTRQLYLVKEGLHLNVISVFLAVCTATLAVQNTASPTLAAVEPTITVQSGNSLINITVEEYTAGVVAHEMPYTFEAEALKAQAVAARTYLYYCLDNSSLYHQNADVCTDITHCPGFITEDELAKRYGEDCARAAMEASRYAAKATAGEIVTYDGKPILAMWHSSSYSRTEDCENVFIQSLPYLRSVESCEDAAGSTASFTLTEVNSILRGAGYRYNGSKNITLTNTPSGRCKSISLGNITLSGTSVRKIFGLRSTDFTAEIYRGRLYFTVRGYGHGVGLSQYGANAMADGGTGYREILSHYYTGTDIGYR